MNIYELERIVEEHRSMKQELDRQRELLHKKAIIARAIVDDEGLVYDLIKCIQKLRCNGILTEKESDIYLEELKIKFAKRGIHFVKPFSKREPRYE